MNNIKNNFSIKDLENFSGVKAHTIRIWEKRYNLLSPERTETNIRSYSLQSLQKLLNVSYLNNNGYKISKIATLSQEKIALIVREIAASNKNASHGIFSFKLAMLNFDQTLFYNTFNQLSQEQSFSSIFYNTFLPLLDEIGLLWQTNSITPAHEHFITTLIRQKIIYNTEVLQSKKQSIRDKTFVLFLPENEIHELGLLYLNYELLLKGHHSILLGPSVPIDNLVDLLSYYDPITFISYFTVKPEKDQISKYLKEFDATILEQETTQFWILGRMLQYIDKQELPKQIKTFQSIDALINEL